MRFEHQAVVSSQIQDALDDLDAHGKADPDEPDDLESPLDNVHLRVGSKLKPVNFGEIESTDPSLFSRFHIRVSDFLSDLLPQSGIPLPEGRRIKFTVEDRVSPRCNSLKLFHSYLFAACSISTVEG